MIGGPAPGAGNVIVGGFRAAVFVARPNTTVQGNFIGTNATGTAGLGGSIGIYHNDGANTTFVGNLISGVETGIFEVAGSANNVIRETRLARTSRGRLRSAIPTWHWLRPNTKFAVGGTNVGDGNLSRSMAARACSRYGEPGQVPFLATRSLAMADWGST